MWCTKNGKRQSSEYAIFWGQQAERSARRRDPEKAVTRATEGGSGKKPRQVQTKGHPGQWGGLGCGGPTSGVLRDFEKRGKWGEERGGKKKPVIMEFALV